MQVEEKYHELGTNKSACTHKEEIPYQLQKMMHKVAVKEGYLKYKIYSRPITTEGGNYIASLYEVDIKGETAAGEKETNIFIKYTIPETDLFDVSNMYSKELFFYNEVSKIFSELESEAAIPPDERYKSVKSYSESNTEAIILQNLAKEGYTTIHRMNLMPLRFAELSVQQLAKFHGLSLAIEYKRPDFFNKKIRTLKPSIEYKEKNILFSKTMYNYSVQTLDNEIREKLDAKLPELLEKYVNYVSGNETKFKCLCHGDYRMNNVLLKMKDEVVTDVVPVDYQFLFYGFPIIDFLYLIFGGTDKEFRRNHLNHLKDIYFGTMESYLKYFQIDINTVYPRKAFERDYDDCLDYALQFMLFLAPLFFTLKVPDLKIQEQSTYEINLDERFRIRLEGVIDDMIDSGKL